MKQSYFLSIVLSMFLMSGYGAEEVPQAQNLLQEAQANYAAGEKAQTIAQRKKAFNQALVLYTQLEGMASSNNNGKLDYNIANTYFQLDEYSWAVLYYYRALALRPADEKLRHNLTVTLNKLGLPEPSKPSVLDQLLFFHTKYSLPERMQLFFILGLILLGCISAFLWWKHRWLKDVLLVLGALCALFLLSITYTRYFSPIEAVMIHTTVLYRDAGEQYAKVSEQPVLPGVKVQVLEVLQNGAWLKVLTPNGDIGYVPNTDIRVI